ncbi:hypothetical protein ABL78_2629 [Leptomonas seymouri]|uniref:Uncharacterized protein n=1 Tax=Leptomonas seymouri TaxID=5684 RepID=A0A0N0P7F5_LEPSE|nr:hypothetical protein ABL78_2629 [Leptomonas seymouri]|eukprot:KPI88267.1 hypothetical protein ABL78_2629 [Leptomonas seymouri]
MSVNQSAESTTSSLQRSGLSITVGDTKSIVLALQALQGKIRSLEQDRDYHQDQYEVSLQAHERYKLDMERQMEQERAAHRKREADLLELLRKAREERAELEAALNGNKEDLGGFRKELEEMIASEKELALQRESKLNKEVTKLRDDIKEEQTRRAALLVTIDKLKAEREAALSTNEQLRIAMDDLLIRFERLQRQQRQRRAPSSEPARRTMSRGGGPAVPPVTVRGGAGRGRAVNVSAVSCRSTRPRVVGSAQHHNYEDPTCSSMLRDVRVIPDELTPCIYPSFSSSLQQQQQQNDDVEARMVDRHASYRSGRESARYGGGRSPGRRGVSAHSSHQHTSPAVVRTSSRSRSTGAQRAAPSSTGAMGQALPSSALGTTAVNEVESQLQSELEELQHQYEDTVTRGSSEEIPTEVLAAALHRISSLIDHKKEQVKLLREARRELEDAVGGTGVPRSPGNGNGVVGKDKSTRRTMLVNELRSLLAEASS